MAFKLPLLGAFFWYCDVQRGYNGLSLRSELLQRMNYQFDSCHCHQPPPSPDIVSPRHSWAAVFLLLWFVLFFVLDRCIAGSLFPARLYWFRLSPLYTSFRPVYARHNDVENCRRLRCSALICIPHGYSHGIHVCCLG